MKELICRLTRHKLVLVNRTGLYIHKVYCKRCNKYFSIHQELKDDNSFKISTTNFAEWDEDMEEYCKNLKEGLDSREVCVFTNKPQDEKLIN